MNLRGKAGVSLRNRSTESRISLVQPTTRLLRVNATTRGATHVRSPRSIHVNRGSLTSRFLLLGIMDPFCREHNLVASKVGARAILRALLGLPVVPEDVPPPEHLPGNPVALHQTVIETDIIPSQGNIQVERD